MKIEEQPHDLDIILSRYENYIKDDNKDIYNKYNNEYIKKLLILCYLQYIHGNIDISFIIAVTSMETAYICGYTTGSLIDVLCCLFKDLEIIDKKKSDYYYYMIVDYINYFKINNIKSN